METLVAVFDKQSDAQQALDALSQEGFSRSQTRLTSSGMPGKSAGTKTQHEESFGDKVAHFFGFGDEDHSTYTEAVRQGSCVLTVEAADDGEAQRACDIIERHNPVNIDERKAEWRQSGWQASENPSQEMGAETRIPVVEEQLQVGKREVQRGGIRVITRTTERPVEETVNLREEHASVKRQPADRAVSDADQAFKEQSFEVQGTAEEAVVGKTARVVEDVIIGKESSTRQQTVKGTVRKTGVEVEQLGKGSGARKAGRYDGEEKRRQSDSNYGGMERRGA
ncbi:MAG TPA: YsnF/AvaK domain-containing protein [Burkholderiales bacterium]|nr:YsnF/AvaK domain-containing protein [Burkholderiales bacterium]